MISISKDEVEAVQDEHAESFHEQALDDLKAEDTPGKDMQDVFEEEVARGELLPSEETASADLPAEADEQEETSHEEAVPSQDMDEDEDAESSHHTQAEEAASADLPAEADEQEAVPTQDMDEDEDAESSHHTQAEETASADLPEKADEQEDEDSESSDSDSEEDSDSDDSSDSDSSSSSSSESAQSEDDLREESASPTKESCPNEAFEGLCSNVAEGTAASGTTELASPVFEEPEAKIPELSATTLWRNKILGRVEAPHLQRTAKNVVRQELPSPASPPLPPRRIVELSSSPGTDALVSLRLSAKELAREKLKMLQQCRAEGHKLLDSSKIHQASISLPQLKMGAKLRGPEGLWEVSQVPQASAHFAKLGKAMPKQATQVRGSKNNHVKASMTESRSLPSISATPSQFGVAAQKQILQARFGEKRSLDR